MTESLNAGRIGASFKHPPGFITNIWQVDNNDKTYLKIIRDGNDILQRKEKKKEKRKKEGGGGPLPLIAKMSMTSNRMVSGKL